MVFTKDLVELYSTYENTVEWHKRAYEQFEYRVWTTPYLIEHRQWIVRNFWGMGDNAHWRLWELLVEQMQDGFKFLEVGVYRGSILSLIPRIAVHQGKEAYTYGVTPLKATTDDHHAYEEHDYAADVERVCRELGEGFQPQLMVGMSYDPHVIADAKIYGPFDIVYIDGGHTYECVAMDIFNYAPLVKPGGFLVMDDASWFLNFEPQIWRGYESVALAIRNHLDGKDRFRELFAIGHNRVWLRKW